MDGGRGSCHTLRTTNSSCNTSKEPTTDDIDPNDSGPNLLDHIHNSSHPSEAQLSGYREDLEEFMEDMLMRAKEADNFLSGLNKFLTSFKGLQRLHAPTASIVYALHNILYGQTVILSAPILSVNLYSNFRWVDVIPYNHLVKV